MERYIDMVCGEVRNYFADHDSRFVGKYTIESGVLSPSDFLQENQYFRIVGSTFNDGVYKNDGKGTLTDETFDGAVWAMKVPADFLAVCEEVKTYMDSDASSPSPYTSESFAGYSYTKGVKADGTAFGWQDAFADKLRRYRRLIV